MSYVKHILQPGEEVRVVGRLHWIIYVPAITSLAVAAVAFGASVQLKYTHYQWPLLVVSVIFAIFWALSSWLAPGGTPSPSKSR